MIAQEKPSNKCLGHSHPKENGHEDGGDDVDDDRVDENDFWFPAWRLRVLKALGTSGISRGFSSAQAHLQLSKHQNPFLRGLCAVLWSFQGVWRLCEN